MTKIHCKFCIEVSCLLSGSITTCTNYNMHKNEGNLCPQNIKIYTFSLYFLVQMQIFSFTVIWKSGNFNEIITKALSFQSDYISSEF